MGSFTTASRPRSSPPPWLRSRPRASQPSEGAAEPIPDSSPPFGNGFVPPVRPEPRGVIPLPVRIRRSDLLQFLGYPIERTPPPRVEDRIEPAIDEARRLADAVGSYRHIPVAGAADVGLEPIDAAGLVIGLVTAGGRIESRVAEYLERNDATGALLLDAAGSAAAEEAADLLGAIVASESLGRGFAPHDEDTRSDGSAADSGSEGLHPDPQALRYEAPHPISCRISPGYGGWPLSAQRMLFDRLPHRLLGISLLPSMMMSPRKSISFAMWLGADARPILGLSGCSRCSLEHCRYRRTKP